MEHKELGRMTCIEKWLLEHPDEKDNVFQTIEAYCPSEFGIMPDPDCCFPDYGITCAKCWMREIPENNETETETENKKENEDMCYTECADVAALKKDLELRDKEIANLIEKLNDRYEGYCASISDRDARIEFLDKELEDCKKRLAEAETGWRTASEERDEFKALCDATQKELDASKRRTDGADRQITNQVNIIENLRAENKYLRNGINSYRETNENLGNQLTAVRIELDKAKIENDILDGKNKVLTTASDALTAENKRMHEEVAEKDRQINGYSKANVRLNDKLVDARAELAKQSEIIESYESGIAEKIMDTFESNLKVWPRQNPHIRPITELPYSRYANHIHMKYKALVGSGFSHDDAMALIPMWDEDEFKGFKNDGFRPKVHCIDEMHEYKEDNK